ncbi:hypothetical protein R0I01_12525 [Bacillus pumilus]|nr:hypothetical protein R0I01_12525 [Bacillus pumilus]
MNLSTAGWMLSIMQFAGLPSTFLTPVFAEKLKKTQKTLLSDLSLCIFTGMIGLLLGGSSPILVISVLLIGIGQGASISLALTFIGLRTTNMSKPLPFPEWRQSLGYLFSRRWSVHDRVSFLISTHTWDAIHYHLLFIILFFMVLSVCEPDEASIFQIHHKKRTRLLVRRVLFCFMLVLFT